MKCYKETGGCGVYEDRSCAECPYSRPQEENTITAVINMMDDTRIGISCVICNGFVDIYAGTAICDECRKRLKEILYPESSD